MNLLKPSYLPEVLARSPRRIGPGVEELRLAT